MKNLTAIASAVLLSSVINLFGQFTERTNFSKTISIEWKEGNPSGTVEVLNGKLSVITIIKGKGKVKGNRFDFTESGENRISVTIDSIRIDPGARPTIISIITKENPFSFFLRDVSKEYPIYIPDYHVVVCRAEDNRSYLQIESEIQKKGLKTKLQKIENEPEVSFESASKIARVQVCPTWLGVSRDFRIFELAQSLNGDYRQYELITPKYPDANVDFPEFRNQELYPKTLVYGYSTGRGQGVEISISRRLEDGVLPIYHSTIIDDDIKYYSTSFVAFEHSPLTPVSGMGTHYLVANKYSSGGISRRQDEELLKQKEAEELGKNEETVLFCRTEATNTGTVPRYAWFKTIKPGDTWWRRYPYNFDNTTGLSSFSKDRVFAVSKLNGKPLKMEEISVLVKPDETVVFEFYLPHRPIPNERARQLIKLSFDAKYSECRNFWKAKLDKAAQIRLPEKRIEEMIQAGLLHLDLNTYGIDPDGTLAANPGRFSPIGSESSPIIQFYNSMGWHDVAKRSLLFFLDKQNDDGSLQNYLNYVIETSAVLWSIGEYFRYTDDKEWVREIEPKLLKACDYLLKWRETNKIGIPHGKGYGMIKGKIEDPEDHYHQYMLNGYGYMGLSRVAEMLASVNPVQSALFKEEAEEWKQSIRESFFNSMAYSPVVPVGDGTWCPTVPPWTETVAPRALFINDEKYYSQGTFTIPDGLLGPLSLVFCEVIDVQEPASKIMLSFNDELFNQQNCAFSQPYYSRHNWIQLKMGMVKPFLKTYYTTFLATSDRETYTFWELLYKNNIHKTHEEAWFLMETRWMLYIEENKTLKLLSGIPRCWLESGKVIDIKNVASYFGPLSFKVTSNLKDGYIEGTVECHSDRKPESVTIRLPHPQGKKPVKVMGGIYDEKNESVLVKPFNGTTYVRIEY